MEKIYPDDKEMIYNIGDWAFHVYRYNMAMEYLERIIETDPNHENALEHLIWTYNNLGMWDKMLECAKLLKNVNELKTMKILIYYT